MRNSKTYLHPFQDELVYYPKKNGKECEFCGLSSIAHKHKPGTLPKDYERIEDEPMSNFIPIKIPKLSKITKREMDEIKRTDDRTRGSNSTQNDWEKRYADMLKEFKRQTKMDMVADVLVMKSFISKEISYANQDGFDEGFAESEKFLKGMKTPFDKPTQNDWVYKSEVEMSRLLQQLEGMELISPKLRQDIEKVCIETNRATRADARKEVLEKVIEQGKILEDSITKDELQSGYYLSGVKRMEKAVLATLREEEVT